MTRRQRRELQGYVAVSTTLGRALLFLAGVGVVGLLSWSIARRVPVVLGGAWWPLAPLLVGAWLLRASGKWTGGPEFRRRVREDIAGGVVAVRRVSAVEAIEVEEAEDEGPAYFVLTRDGQTLYLAFQELSRYKSRGFPWTEFEFIESPRCGTFFSIRKVGERLRPSQVRPPLERDEIERFGGFNERYRLLDVEFAELKKAASRVAAG